MYSLIVSSGSQLLSRMRVQDQVSWLCSQMGTRDILTMTILCFSQVNRNEQRVAIGSFVKYDPKSPQRFELLIKTSLQECWASVLWYSNQMRRRGSRVNVDSYFKGAQKNQAWILSVEPSEVGLVLFRGLIKGELTTSQFRIFTVG